MDKNYFGERVAARYDESCADQFDASVLGPTVDLLVEAAGTGAALELGIGTGRVAIPLSQRGVEVHGIELSEAMVAQLRSKEGGRHLCVTVGDFASAALDRTFSLAYLVFNTIMNLTTQDAQVACFRNVARHLEPGGRFVVEVLVPGLQRLAPGERLLPYRVTGTNVDVDEIDVATQRLVSHHYLLTDTTYEVNSVPFRYVWPAELDLMARLAGMTLEARWADWRRTPFTNDSTTHVSVWRAPQ